MTEGWAFVWAGLVGCAVCLIAPPSGLIIILVTAILAVEYLLTRPNVRR